MRVRGIVAASFLLGTVVVAYGQGRQQSRFDGHPPAQQNPVPSPSHGPIIGVPQSLNTIPTSPILPMSNPIAPMRNPIAPMSNPIAPIVSPPFIRYDTVPTVVFPQQEPQSAGRPGRGAGRGDGYPNRRGRGNAYSSNSNENPFEVQGTFRTPGSTVTETPSAEPTGPQGPGRDRVAPRGPRADEPEEPEVRQPVQPRAPRPRPLAPAIGTLREEVIQKIGVPWGRFSVAGAESLYFDGDLVVVIRDGRVNEVR